jgi:restriction system protein
VPDEQIAETLIPMAIPDFQSTMLPILRLVSDRTEISVAQLTSELAAKFRLSPEEETEMLDSGRQTRWANRVAWAVSHMYQAGLISRPSRGYVALTEDGRNLVANPPDRVTLKFLSAYPSYVEFRARTRKRAAVTDPDGHDTDSQMLSSPTEVLEETFAEYRTAIAQELLARTKQVKPSFFETLVVELLVAMGYGGSFKDAAQAIGKTGDGGIDGIIKEDRLGLDFVAVQAKRWDHSVGREVVQAFAGSLMGHGASKGVLITTSSFTSGANDYAQRISANKIVLIDGEQLAELMLDYGIGVTDVTSYRIQRVDSDYFDGS